MRKERVALEHHRGAPLDGREPDHVLAADQDLPHRRVFRPAIILRIVLLPQPEGREGSNRRRPVSSG